MFVGATGIARVLARTLEVMREIKSDDPAQVREAGAIDLPTMQRFLNFWFSSSLDLFGAEISSNAANYFAAGLKGRPDERRYEDHVAAAAVLALDLPQGGDRTRQEVPLRSAVNEVTRRAYAHECDNAVGRWNRQITEAGHDFRLALPSPRFRRAIGVWAGVPCDPQGRRVPGETWRARQDEWLPSEADRDFIKILMRPVTEPGKIAGWIAPPERGINDLPADYEYVRL